MRAAIVFDLDGTLVDSLPDIAAAANRMLADTGTDPLTEGTIKQFVGNGLPKLVERVITHCDLPPERHAELTQATLTHYNAASSDKTVPYPGVPDALRQLRDFGCTLGVCTNKPEKPARHVLEALGLAEYFDVVLGGDSLPCRKPDPTHLMTCFDALAPTKDRLFVGDSEVDAETAQRAKIPFLLFTEGYRKSPIAEIPHDVTYDHAHQMPGRVAGFFESA